MVRRLLVSLVTTAMVAAIGVASASVAAADSVDISKLVVVKKVAPKYPRKAAIAGVSGWVEIEFDVSANGEVDSPKVVHAKPKRVFDRAAVRALAQWKFAAGNAPRHSKVRIDFSI